VVLADHSIRRARPDIHGQRSRWRRNGVRAPRVAGRFAGDVKTDRSDPSLAVPRGLRRRCSSRKSIQFLDRRARWSEGSRSFNRSAPGAGIRCHARRDVGLMGVRASRRVMTHGRASKIDAPRANHRPRTRMPGRPGLTALHFPFLSGFEVDEPDGTDNKCVARRQGPGGPPRAIGGTAFALATR